MILLKRILKVVPAIYPAEDFLNVSFGSSLIGQY